MLQILSHTPFWVFGLLLGLIILGLQQTRNRQVKLWLAYLLPTGMVILSLVGVVSNFGAQVISLSLWLSGLALMTFLGYKLFAINDVRYLASSYQFYIPGSWIPLLVILAIFFTKYVVAVLYALNNPITSQVAFMPILCLAYGGFSGYFVSRALCLVRASRNSTTPLSAN
ncbi:MAG: hypothetical protein B0W54_13130 [Cellvibrio sp. 79]|nr:MAG: hypothetical protein B0W54_13130 [Cellvibrio sp. 79]